MVGAVARQGAIAAAEACGEVFEPAVGGGGHVVAIEVDEVGDRLDAVRVVAGGTGGAFIHDVEAVKREAVIGEDADTVVAFVTEGVGAGAFGVEILEHKLAFENRLINGAVGAVGAGAAAPGALVAVVTVGAVNATGGAPAGQEVGTEGFLPAVMTDGRSIWRPGIQGVLFDEWRFTRAARDSNCRLATEAKLYSMVRARQRCRGSDAFDTCQGAGGRGAWATTGGRT